MWGWNVGVNGMRSVFSFWGVCSADCRSIRLGAVVAHLNDGNRIATLYDGQFMLSTQLIVLNYPIILSHRRGNTVSLEAYPLLFCWSVVTIQNTLFPEESLSQQSEKSVYRINWWSSTEKNVTAATLTITTAICRSLALPLAWRDWGTWTGHPVISTSPEEFSDSRQQLFCLTSLFHSFVALVNS